MTQTKREYLQKVDIHKIIKENLEDFYCEDGLNTFDF